MRLHIKYLLDVTAMCVMFMKETTTKSVGTEQTPPHKKIVEVGHTYDESTYAASKKRQIAYIHGFSEEYLETKPHGQSLLNTVTYTSTPNHIVLFFARMDRTHLVLTSFVAMR